MFSKLRNKFLFVNMVLTLLTLFAAFAVVYIVTSSAMDSDNKAKLNAAIAASITQEGNGDMKLYALDESDTALMKTFGMPAFTIFTDDKGALLEIKRIFGTAFDFNITMFNITTNDDFNYNAITLTGSSSYNKFMDAALSNRGSAKMAKVEGRVWLYSVIDMDAGKTQFTFLDITESHDSLHRLLLTFALVSIVMIAVVFLISLFTANRAIRPIRLNWEKQRQFVADASHELKTPLAVMTSTYSALQANGDETIKSQSEFFGYMKNGMDKMTKLITDLLSLARMENTSRNVNCAPFDIGAEVEKATQKFEAVLREKSVAFSCSIGPDIVIESDHALSIQAFEILFDNAVKYVNEGGEIDVTLKREKHAVVCTVGNSGEGIDRADLPRIFDRFYRTDSSRSSETGGYGLGLSIAKSIMDALGGKISATSENGWTAFSLTWNL